MTHFLKTNIVILLAIIISGGIMSFTLAENKADSETFYYVSPSMDEGAFRTVSNWTSDATTGNVGCIASGQRPCKIIVPDGSSLSGVLGSKTNSQVLAIAVDRKAAP